jgi:hypothetical protein
MTHIIPTATPAWQALTVHYDKIKTLHLREMFAKDPGRSERFVAEGAGLYLDYSKNRITGETLRLLLRLAEERGVAAWRDAMFRGEKINITEGRAAFHVALRAPKGSVMRIDGVMSCPMFMRSSAIWANSPGGCAMGEVESFRSRADDTDVAILVDAKASPDCATIAGRGIPRSRYSAGVALSARP